jgi:hypothetical protein
VRVRPAGVQHHQQQVRALAHRYHLPPPPWATAPLLNALLASAPGPPVRLLPALACPWTTQETYCNSSPCKLTHKSTNTSAPEHHTESFLLHQCPPFPCAAPSMIPGKSSSCILASL